jgi:hypothetical protein
MLAARSKGNFAGRRAIMQLRTAQIRPRHVRHFYVRGRRWLAARGVIDCRGTGRVMSRNNYMQIARARRPFIRWLMTTHALEML